METNLLTLGDMLAFIGLIIAAIQLSKPRLLLMWKLTSASLRYFAIVLLILGYLSPLIATFMSKDVNKLELFGKGLSVAEFTQIMGFLLISFGVIVVGYIFSSYNRRHLLTLTTKYKIHRHKYPKKKWSTFQITVERKRVVTTRSARKFYFITSKYFVRGHIEAVVEAIGANLEPLVFSAKQYDPHIYRMIDDENKEKLKPVGANYCFETLLQLLSDDSAMQHICTSNRPFLHALINHEVNVGSNNNRNELSIILYENVLEKLLLNPKSFIYSQMNTHEGSARFVNIYSLLTQDKIIRRHNIIPSMITWNANNAKVPLDSYTKALTKLLERIVKSYKADPDNDMRIANIRSILGALVGDSGVTRRIAYNTFSREQHSKDPVDSIEANCIRSISSALTHLLKDDDPEIFKTNDSELKATNNKRVYEINTLVGLAANYAYEAIEDLTRVYDDYPDSAYGIRNVLFDFLHIYTNTKVAKRYKTLLYERLFDKAEIGDYSIASNLKGYYPNVLRPMINFMLPFSNFGDEVDANAKNKMLELMKGPLADALLAGKKMSNDVPMIEELLPEKIKAIVNKSKKTVTYYYIDSKGKRNKIDLNKPIALTKNIKTTKNQKSRKS